MSEITERQKLMNEVVETNRALLESTVGMLSGMLLCALGIVALGVSLVATAILYTGGLLIYLFANGAKNDNLARRIVELVYTYPEEPLMDRKQRLREDGAYHHRYDSEVEQ